jgi:hypothetical protein
VTKIFEAFGRNHRGLKDVVGFCSHEKGEASSWQQQKFCGWFREVAVNGWCWGEVEPGFA